MFGKFLLRTIVGLGVFVLFGGKDALGFLFMAVICTYGLGLIVVIPAAYLLGLLCTIWFIPFGSSGDKPEEKSPQSAEVERENSLQRRSALQDYIAGAESKGQEWQAIRADLIRMGWAAEIVDNARKGLGPIKEDNY